MPIDTSFYGLGKTVKISELVKLVCTNNKEILVKFKNVKNKKISSASTLKSSTKNDLSFLDNLKYMDSLNLSKAGCIVLSDQASKSFSGKTPLIICENPRRFFALSLNYLYQKNFVPQKDSLIHKNAKISKGVIIGKGVIIEENVCIGPNTVIGNGVKIAKNTIIGSNCSIYYSIIGQNSEIYSGVRLGNSGFGFDFDERGVVKFPHLGRVVIGDNVEVGANSTVDRGTLDDTIIEDFTMIDNLVHIAHNVIIGKGSVICGQSGIAGSSKLGGYVLMGAQSGVSGHISIASGTVLTARAGVTKTVKTPITLGGFPAIPINEFKREKIFLRKYVKQTKGKKN